MKLRFQDDGSFVLHLRDGVPEKQFGTLLDALNFAHSLSPHSDVRLTVYDASGREIIETFV
jgi:hypothetical protein